MRRPHVLIGALSLAAAAGCAGTGHRYGCDADAGSCEQVYYTSSRRDPRAAALDHEATQLEAIRLNLDSAVMAVPLYPPSAPIGK